MGDRLKGWLLVGVGALALTYAAVQQARQGRPPSRGHAPDFQMERWDGGKVTLTSLKGQLVLLDFWATWCGPCSEEMPSLLQVAHDFAPRGVTLVAASRDDPDTWRVDVGLFADKKGKALTGYAAFANDPVSDAFHVEVLPTLYILGRDGTILASYVGYASADQLRRRVEQALRSAD